MSRTRIRDALIGELRKLRPGEAGDKAALKTAIGCSAAELDGAIDALRFSGKIGFYRLVLAPSMMAGPPSGGGSEPISAGAGQAPTISAPPEPVAAMGGGDMPPEPAPPGSRRAASCTPAEQTDLIARVRAFLAQTGWAKSRFGYAVCKDYALVDRLTAHRPTTRTRDRILAFIADEAGAPPAPAPRPEPEVMRAVAAEAEAAGYRRLHARRLSGQVALDAPGLGEAVATLLVETPHDLVAGVNRKHPALWRRVCALARGRGDRPGPTLYALLEQALDRAEAGEMAAAA